MHPPGKENGTRQGAALKTAYDVGTVAHSAGDGQLFPEIVLDLQARNVPHVYRPSSREVVVACPICGNKMILSTEKPYWLCLTLGRCATDQMTWKQVVEALVEKAMAT
jgi:hypothetical protein